jgi:hypothetical protein
LQELPGYWKKVAWRDESERRDLPVIEAIGSCSGCSARLHEEHGNLPVYMQIAEDMPVHIARAAQAMR